MLKANPRRQAIDSQRGYAFQIYATALEWTKLIGGQAICVEGAEDADLLGPGGDRVEAIQYKDIRRPVTLASKSVAEAITNLFDHARQNPGIDIRMRLLTTARRGRERARPFGRRNGLDVWDGARTSDVDLESIRSFLVSYVSLPEKVKKRIGEMDREELRKELIDRIVWVTDYNTIEGVRSELVNGLIEFGVHHGVNVLDSEKAVDTILNHVWSVARKKQDRILTLGEFAKVFDDATRMTISKRDYNVLVVEAQHFKVLVDHARRTPVGKEFRDLVDRLVSSLPPSEAVSPSGGERPSRSMRQRRGKPVILSTTQRLVLAILVVSPIKIDIDQFIRVFGRGEDFRALQLLIRRGLVKNNKKLGVERSHASIIKSDSDDVVRGHNLWIDRLWSTRLHPEVAFILFAHLAALGDINRAVLVVSDLFEAGEYDGDLLDILNLIVSDGVRKRIEPSMRIRAMAAIGFSCVYQGKLREAAALGKRCAALAQRNGDTRAMASYYLLCARIAGARGDRPLQEVNLRNAAASAAKGGDSIFLSRVLLELASCIEEYSLTQASAQAENSFEALGKSDPSEDKIRALVEKARIDVRLGKKRMALKALRRAVALVETSENTYKKADSLCRIGWSYRFAGETHEAIRCFELGMKIAGREQHGSVVCESLRGLAVIGLDHGRKGSKARFVKLIEYEARYGSAETHIQAICAYSAMCHNAGDEKEARRVIGPAIKLAESRGLYGPLLDCQFLYAVTLGADGAIDYLVKLSTRYESSMPPDYMIKMWLSIGQLGLVLKSPSEKVESFLRKALDSLLGDNDGVLDEEALVAAIALLVKNFTHGGNYQAVVELLRWARKRVEGRHRMLAMSLLNDEIVALESLNHIDEAIAATNKLIRIGERCNAGDVVALARINLSELLRQFGDCDGALREATAAEEWYSANGDINRALHAARNKSVILTNLGRLDDSERLLKYMLKVAKKRNEREVIANAFYGLAVVANQRGKSKVALGYCSEAWGVAVSCDEFEKLVEIGLGYSELLLDAKRASDCIDVLKNVPCQTASDRYKSASILFHANLDLGNLSNAVRCAEDLVSISAEMGDPDAKLESLLMLSATLSDSGRFKEADSSLTRCLPLIKEDAEVGGMLIERIKVALKSEEPRWIESVAREVGKSAKDLEVLAALIDGYGLIFHYFWTCDDPRRAAKYYLLCIARACDDENPLEVMMRIVGDCQMKLVDWCWDGKVKLVHKFSVSMSSMLSEETGAAIAAIVKLPVSVVSSAISKYGDFSAMSRKDMGKILISEFQGLWQQIVEMADAEGQA